MSINTVELTYNDSNGSSNMVTMHMLCNYHLDACVLAGEIIKVRIVSGVVENIFEKILHAVTLTQSILCIQSITFYQLWHATDIIKAGGLPFMKLNVLSYKITTYISSIQFELRVPLSSSWVLFYLISCGNLLIGI